MTNYEHLAHVPFLSPFLLKIGLLCMLIFGLMTAGRAVAFEFLVGEITLWHSGEFYSRSFDNVEEVQDGLGRSIPHPRELGSFRLHSIGVTGTSDELVSHGGTRFRSHKRLSGLGDDWQVQLHYADAATGQWIGVIIHPKG